ncbi:hypothetical protein HY637_06255 [Candidatus Woesearchaeota archaeon]|nr:hypothetical protein [Candidatus Woesearchaeota archaeon]
MNLDKLIKLIWKKRSYWQRGAILGFVYGIIAAFLFILSWRFPINLPGVFDFIPYFLIMLTYGIWFGLADGYNINETLALILAILIYSAIGAFIGLILWKIKTLNSWLGKIKSYWKGPLIGFVWFLLNYVTHFLMFMIVDFFSIDSLTSGGVFYWVRLITKGTIGFPDIIFQKVSGIFSLPESLLLILVYALLGILVYYIYAIIKNIGASKKIAFIVVVILLAVATSYNTKLDHEDRMIWPSDELDKSCRNYCLKLNFRSSYMEFNDNANLFRCSCFTQYESRKAEAYFDENFERKEFVSISENRKLYSHFIIRGQSAGSARSDILIPGDENSKYMVQVFNINPAKRTTSLKINNQTIVNLGFNKEVKLDDGATFGLIGLAETRVHYYFNTEESVKIEYYIGK